MAAAVAVLQGHGLRVSRVGPVRVAWAGRCVFDAQVAGHAVVVKTDQAAARCAREAAVLRTAHAAGIPVPEVLAHVSGAVSVLVLRRLGGAALGATSRPVAWRGAGSWLRRLHAVAPAPAVTTAARPGQSMRDHLLEATLVETRRAKDGGLLAPGHCRRIRTLLQSAWQGMQEPALCLVHGDAQPEHFLIDADAQVTGLLDFGDAHRGDPVYDLAVLTLEHPHLLAAVLEGYRPATALRARINTLIEPYRLLRRIGAANWLHETGLDPRPHLLALTRADSPASATQDQDRAGAG